MIPIFAVIQGGYRKGVLARIFTRHPSINNSTAAMLDIMIIRTLFNKGSRVPLRGKVNEAVTTGESFTFTKVHFLNILEAKVVAG